LRLNQVGEEKISMDQEDLAWNKDEEEVDGW